MSNVEKTDEELNLAYEAYQAYWVDLPLPEAEDMAAEITDWHYSTVVEIEREQEEPDYYIPF